MEEKRPLLQKRATQIQEDSSTNENISNWKALKELFRQDCLPCIPARYVLAFVSFLGFVNVYILRVNLSMAIIQMVNTTSNVTLHDQFDWTSTQQGWILSAFFYGYILTQVPGGYLAGVLGGRLVYGVGIVMTAILSLFTPLAARIHFGALIALRVLEGFFEGVTFPAMHHLWGKWAPPAERSILSTITYSGPFIGNVISFPLSAVLCVYGFDGGWPSVFYIFGSIGVLWCILWLLLGFDSPSTHPRISQSERIHIESSIASAQKNEETEKIPIPWFQIFTSGPVWAIIVAHFCLNWGNYTMLTCIPSYFHDALNLSYGNDIIKNGIYSGIPYVGFVLATLIGGQLADYLRWKWLSTKAVRKLYTSIACVGGAGGLLVAGYVGKTQLEAVIYVTISITCAGFAQAGFSINHIDIAPRFAGVLMGITNTAGTIPGIIGPLVAKMIAHKPAPYEDPSIVYKQEWQEVFILAAEIYLFGGAIYLILADGEKQWWADGIKHHKRDIVTESRSVHSTSPELVVDDEDYSEQVKMQRP